MNIPAVDEYANHINPTWIFVTWPNLADEVALTGGDSPVYYGLEWD